MINQHTPGPLSYDDDGFIYGEGNRVSDPHSSAEIDVDEREANAALITSAYNQFDRAARELGVDATELAEKIDLLKILKEWSSCNPNPLRENPPAPLVVEYGVRKHLSR